MTKNKKKKLKKKRKRHRDLLEQQLKEIEGMSVDSTNNEQNVITFLLSIYFSILDTSFFLRWSVA